MPRNAELVALLREAADMADAVMRLRRAIGVPHENAASIAARLRTAADALAGEARDRERLDWLESSDEYAIGHPAIKGDDWWLFFNDDARDVKAPTLRAAIDAAMHTDAARAAQGDTV